MQQRAYEEVRDVMERHGGKINHETIAEMEYLEAVIMENLRVHTPVLAHIRVCREDCEVWQIHVHCMCQRLFHTIDMIKINLQRTTDCSGHADQEGDLDRAAD